MLTLTRPAANLLAEARARQGIAADASVRVASTVAQDGDEPGITLGFVDAPYDGDQIGTVHGIGICVAPEVAAALDDAAIDVEDRDGDPHLVLVQAQ
jgi:Fe-S cluster assembly iron-binding protein IscA